MERCCYDEKKGAFGAWFIGEDPFYGTFDFGWDSAVGRPANVGAPSLNGQKTMRLYGWEINLMMYEVYLMLAAVTDGAQAETFFSKARALEPFLKDLEGGEGKPPSNGLYLMEDGHLERPTGESLSMTGLLSCFPPDRLPGVMIFIERPLPPNSLHLTRRVSGLRSWGSGY